MTSAPLRFGVCGTAHWAETVHMPALMGMAGVSLVAIQGRNAERREMLARNAGIAAFGDFAAFLDAVDAVSFAIPPDAQPDLAEQALRAGKAIIVEKPVARSAERAQALLDLATERNAPAVCFLTRRYIPEIAAGTERARAAVPTGGHTYFRSAAQGASSPYANSLWRKEADGLIWDVGPHALTPLIRALGPVASVEACRETPAGCTFDLRHVSGTRSSVAVEQGGPQSAMADEYSFETPGGPIKLVGVLYDRVAAFQRAIQELLDLRREGRGPGEAFTAAVHITAIIEAALASRETHRPTPVPPT